MRRNGDMTDRDDLPDLPWDQPELYQPTRRPMTVLGAVGLALIAMFMIGGLAIVAFFALVAYGMNSWAANK
jgi:hypothetical protein